MISASYENSLVKIGRPYFGLFCHTLIRIFENFPSSLHSQQNFASNATRFTEIEQIVYEIYQIKLPKPQTLNSKPQTPKWIRFTICLLMKKKGCAFQVWIPDHKVKIRPRSPQIQLCTSTLYWIVHVCWSKNMNFTCKSYNNCSILKIFGTNLHKM